MIFFNKKKQAITSTVDKTKILNEKSPFMIKETYKSLRTNLMFSLQNDEEGGKVIVFSSAVPSEGKTTVCFNTAITFAQTGAKVLVIDADLRIPKLHKYLSMDGKQGFSNVLGGFADWKSVVKHMDEYNLDCILGGHIPPNPAELLSSKTTATVLEELKQTYDYIFLDTPPVNVVTDALAIAPLCSGVVLIVREKYTLHNSIKQVLKAFEFAHIKVLGIVYNCAELPDQRRGSYRKKRYSYSNYGRYYTYAEKNIREK